MPEPSDRRLILSSLLILAVIPFTIAFGVTVLRDRSYYLISAAILIDTMLPFFLVFDHRKPKAREIVLVCSMAAIAVVGRMAFFMLPEFKPVAAIVIVSAVSLGPESGFLVGALAAFVSNFFFGQGPWTPWQMFSFGIIGFLAGILSRKKLFKQSKAVICIYGGLSTFLIYGGLMNFDSVLMASSVINRQILIATYLSGIPFDLVHAGSTVLFLFFIEKPMIEKVTRVRVKYGLLDEAEQLEEGP
jgi:energy-coupling factor transport system substrate-specific component